MLEKCKTFFRKQETGDRVQNKCKREDPMKDAQILTFPPVSGNSTKDEYGLSDEDLVNLVKGMVRLLQRYADSDRLSRIFLKLMDVK